MPALCKVFAPTYGSRQNFFQPSLGFCPKGGQNKILSVHKCDGTQIHKWGDAKKKFWCPNLQRGGGGGGKNPKLGPKKLTARQ